LKNKLYEIKWNDGFECLKCGHKETQLRKDYSLTCYICSHQESKTSSKLFHKVKFGVRKVFFIIFEMATDTKNLSDSYIKVCYGGTERTAHLCI
jgi:hypothetical protein